MKRLLLFDIDGTLLSTDGAAKRSFQRALLEVYGTVGPIDSHRFDGKTDPQIARELLNLAGLGDTAIDARFPVFWPAYLRELKHEMQQPGYSTKVYPGVHDLLATLEARSPDVVVGLLTGNVKEGAQLKLSSAGIEGYFRLGAFGSDHERRDCLPEVAVNRARDLTGIDFRGKDVVVIGDTPNDITCGKSIGVCAIGVTTGRHDLQSLQAAGADAVLPDLSDTRAVLDLLLREVV